MRVAVAVAALLVATPLAADDARRLERLAERVDRYLQPYRDDGHLSGVLRVEVDGLPPLVRVEGRAAERDTRFLVASVSKPLTAALVVRLAEAGRLRLDAPIGALLPDAPGAGSITAVHLIRHRSGVPHRLVPPGERSRAWTPEELTARAAALPLDFEPGARTSYSNGGYSVLAALAERAGGAPFHELLRRHVLEPAGMARSAAAGAFGDGVPPEAARPFVPAEDGPRAAPDWNPTYLEGAASLWSTADDLHRFVAALESGALGPTARDLLLAGEGPTVWSGNVNGWRAFVHRDAARGVEVVFAGNLHSGAVDRMQRDLPALAAGRRVRTPGRLEIEPVAVDAADLRRYEGLYRIPGGAEIPFRVAGGRLWADGWILIPLGDGRFFSPQDYVTLEAVGGGDGPPRRWNWITDRGTAEAPRTGDLPEAAPTPAPREASPASAGTPPGPAAPPG